MEAPTATPTKPSGIPWLGEVPAHWEVKRLKHVAKLRSGEAITIDAIEEEGAYPVFGGNGLRGFTEGYTHEGDYALIGRQGALCGNVNYAHGKFWASEHAVVCHPVSEVDHLWLGELLRSMNLGQYSQSAAQPGLAVERIEALLIPVPPLPEQRAIAAFLDERTARIDALVARKRRLVQLLKEKRQALITRAVTRGLDPKAKMKESGVPWLGVVPEGWGVKPLRSVGTFQNGISAGADYFGSGYPFVNYKDVYQWPSLPEQVEGLANSTDIDQERYSVREGDIFFTRTSETNEEIGFASTCLRTMEHATFSGFLIRVRPHRGLLAPNFSKHFFRSDVHRAFFVKEMNLVTRASLGQELLKRLPVLLPPVNEQVAIAEFLDDRLNRIDDLVTKVEQAVERLQEYRTALISAAVTGKVRATRGASADKG